ncbi:MAG: type II secretion system F family protein, partial [Planctomycetota bacterium]
MKEVYRGLASLLRAGFVPADALRVLRENGTLRDPLGAALCETVSGGAALSAALERSAGVPPEEVAILEAGEASGRLDDDLDRLARLCELRAFEVRRFWTSIRYPILLFHFAALVIPYVVTVTSAGVAFGLWLLRVLLVLGPVYGVVAAVLWLRRFPAWRRRGRRLVAALPGFGAAARQLRA